MNASNQTIIKYFGFGTNKDFDMMVHMVGKNDLAGEPGQLLGFELCIQKASQMRDEVPKNSPAPISPRKIIEESWGPDFEMFVARPNPDGIIYGTIWDLTPEDMELVKEWELVEYGMQEEVMAIAIDAKGNIIQVETQALMKGEVVVDRVITGADYDPHIASKDKMLKIADESRLNYLKQKNEKRSS